MGFWFCFWVCCVVLFVCVHVSCYILHLFIFCFSLLFCALGFILSAVFLFVSSFLRPCRCLASLALSCMTTGFGLPMEGFLGMGGGGAGPGSMQEGHCAFHLRLRGGGCAHALARKGQRQQRSRGRHSSTEDGASWLKKEKALTSQRAAQVASRRKKNCRFPWQAAEISWQAQHRGWRKLAQEGKKNADFVAGTAKRLKIAKSCFIFGF